MLKDQIECLIKQGLLDQYIARHGRSRSRDPRKEKKQMRIQSGEKLTIDDEQEIDTITNH